MDAIVAHLQDKWMAYTAILVCSVPLLYLFRKQIVPVVWYTGEMIVYIALFHMLLHGLVRLTRWFKLESTFTFMSDKADPGWNTPVFAIWDREVYNPPWLFYLEATVAILIVAGVIRYRPFAAQKSRPREAAPRKGMASQVRPLDRPRSGGKR